MRTLICILILVPLFAQAQPQPHKADLFLKVADDTEAIVPFLKVTLKTTENTKPQYSITDTKGNARFNVTTGNSYKVFIMDTQFVSTINIPLNRLSYVTQKITIPALSEQDMVNRTTIDTIDQHKLTVQRPDEGNIFFKVGLSNHLNQSIKNTEVRVFNEKLKMVYTAKTNSYGFAQFHIPGRNKYIIGVNNFDNFDTVTVPHHSFGLRLTYIPTKIREYENNDTITQFGSSNMRTTTDRALVKVHLKDHDNKPLAKEDVFFDVIGTNKVYYGQTASDGVLTMLLPKGQQYELSFKYERAMKRLDYPMDPTLFTTQFYMTYIGSKKVEEFYANASRNSNGFRNDFMEGKATKMQLEAGIFEETSHGFNLNFPDEGAILTPAVHNEKLFVSAGYYSPNIYCINAETGESIWGVQLAENGPSVLVVDDGMLLINTQSCTLYAIDIETGILAWSKWLGPNIYHSPTVKDGKVYASYPEELSYAKDQFVIAAFSLKTGAIIWQNRLKSEPLSAPVASNKNLFITDLDGNLYNFNAENGEQIAMTNAQVTCAPTFDGNYLLANSINKNNPKFSNVVVYNPNNLNLIKTITHLKDSSFSHWNHNHKASLLMSYSRNRVFIHKNHYYQINKKGLQAFNLHDGEVKWMVSLKSNLSYNPVLAFAGKYLLASSHSSKLALIDPVKAQKVKEYYLSEIISSEPVIANGWIYCGTKNGKLVAINTKDKSITGWNQWGMNAAHNPVIE